MGGSEIDSRSLQQLAYLDRNAQAAMTEVTKEGAKASPVALQAAQAALAELMDFLRGLPQ
jgi:hypothetical protein